MNRPESRPSLAASARSLREFGSILILSGATRGKTEVLSLLMGIVAVVVLVITRAFGLRGTGLI
jgi:molybdate transport system permease protein